MPDIIEAKAGGDLYLEHYGEAVEMLDLALEGATPLTDTDCIAVAQVHATLAQALAVRLVDDYNAWKESGLR